MKLLLSTLALFVVLVTTAGGQTDAELGEAFIKGMALMKEGKMAEAVPHLEVLVKALPDQGNLRVMYGAALLTKSKQIDDVAQAKKLAAGALEQFQAAKRLGVKDPQLDTFIELLGGAPSVPTEKLSEVEKVLLQAETHFARSNYDEALVLYHKALSLDPKSYQAALHAGDSYVAKQDWENAERFYQKAIAIDPQRETAYRYSATPFMRQKKYDLARDRYIEAYITEPYNDKTSMGMSQWADAKGVKLGHPKVDIPEFKYDTNGKPTTVMNEASLTEASKAWVAYSLVRDNWRKEKFSRAFPNEKTYRHSMQEETEALRSVLKTAKEQKLAHPHIETLQKLDDEGLLESFVLLATADDGIAEDHGLYLKDNRPRLRKYVLAHVIQK